MRTCLSRIPPDSFCWQRWRSCDVVDMFGCFCRKDDLLKRRGCLRKYAVGYIEAEKLLCRPKKDNFAVMFLKDDEYSWFHLRIEEFELIFGGE